MAKKTKEELKKEFANGQDIEQTIFFNLIDSSVEQNPKAIPIEDLEKLF